MPYNVADATRDIDDLIVRPAHVFKEKQGIDVRIEHKVEGIDPSGKIVTGRTRAGEPFRISYDKLLMATGARPVLPDLPGVNSPGSDGAQEPRGWKKDQVIHQRSEREESGDSRHGLHRF